MPFHYYKDRSKTQNLDPPFLICLVSSCPCFLRISEYLSTSRLHLQAKQSWRKKVHLKNPFSKITQIIMILKLFKIALKATEKMSVHQQSLNKNTFLSSVKCLLISRVAKIDFLLNSARSKKCKFTSLLQKFKFSCCHFTLKLRFIWHQISINIFEKNFKVFIQPYPYLQLDPFVLSEDGLDFEIDAHGGDEGRSERVVSIAEKEAGFAHRAVPNNQQFEHVVKVLVGSVFLPSSTLCRHLWKRKY